MHDLDRKFNIERNISAEMEEILILLLLVLSTVISMFAGSMIMLAKSETKQSEEDTIDLEIKGSHNGELAGALNSVEFLCYGSGLVIFSIWFDNYVTDWYWYAGGIFAYMLILFVVRFFFYSLGIRFSNNLYRKSRWLINLLYTLCSPFAYLILKMEETIGGQSSEEASREDINQIVETAHEEGSIKADEYRILKSIMKYDEVLVSDVMTPRTVVFSCEADKRVKDIMNMPELQMYSRIPLREGESMDDGVTGYVMSRDVLSAAISGKEDIKLKDLNREVYFIPESAGVDKALDKFLHRHQHLLMVVDEYGDIEGLISMEDVLETILGVEIMDEGDKIADLRMLAKQRRDKRIMMNKGMNPAGK